MTFEFSKFYQSYRQLKDIAVKQKLIAFWDLETDTQLASSEHVLAVIVVGLEAFGELTETDVQAIHIVIGARIQINHFPNSVLMLTYSLLAQLQPAGKSSGYAHAAALVATDAAANVGSLDSEFKNLFGPIDVFVEKLAQVFRIAGDYVKEAELYQLQAISECAKAKYHLIALLRQADLHLALNVALKSVELDRQWFIRRSERIESYLEKDYRRLKSCRSVEATVGDRVFLWLMTIVYPSAGTNTKALASPSHLKKLMLPIEEPRQTILLLKISLQIEALRQKSKEGKAAVLSSSFHEMLVGLDEPDVLLVVLLATATVAAAEGDLQVASYFFNLYRSKSFEFSQGSSRDLLFFHVTNGVVKSVVTNRHDVETRQFSRGLKVSSSALKMLGVVAMTKLQSLVHTDANRSNQIKEKISLATRQFVGDLSELRGALHKFAQLGFLIQNDLPFEWRDEMAKGLNANKPMSESSLEKVLKENFSDVAKVFKAFDHSPFACGSIGQVHRALLNSGESVCVKVRYAGISAAVKADFKNIKALLPFLKALLPNQPIKELAIAWEEMTLIECDFHQEALNHELVSEAIKGCAVIVPKVFREWSTENILVTEMIEGDEFFYFLANSNQESRSRIGVELWRSIYVLLSRGLFRGDIQPANYLIKNGTLVMLDLGAVNSGSRLGLAATHLKHVKAWATGDQLALAALLLEEGWTDSKMSESSARILIEVLNRPFRGEFEFTDAYVNEVYRVTTKTLSKSMILQPEGGFVVRVIWSMFSMLAMLKAKADWYQELADVLELEKTAKVTTKSTRTAAS